MEEYDRYNEYARELKTKPNLNPALFWAGKMANIGLVVATSNIGELGIYPKLLVLIIEEYNSIMINEYFSKA